jgi:hypothetical protein
VVDDARAHARFVLGKIQKFGAVAPRHMRESLAQPRQHRVEEILLAAFALLRALRRRLLLARARKRLAAELVAVGKARHPGIVLRIVAVVARILDPPHNAPAPAELHGAHVDHVHARLGDEPVGLLDDNAGNAAPAEVAREGKPDRAAAHDQHWRFHGSAKPQADICPIKSGPDARCN